MTLLVSADNPLNACLLEQQSFCQSAQETALSVRPDQTKSSEVCLKNWLVSWLSLIHQLCRRAICWPSSALFGFELQHMVHESDSDCTSVCNKKRQKLFILITSTIFSFLQHWAKLSSKTGGGCVQTVWHLCLESVRGKNKWLVLSSSKEQNYQEGFWTLH